MEEAEPRGFEVGRQDLMQWDVVVFVWMERFKKKYIAVHRMFKLGTCPSTGTHGPQSDQHKDIHTISTGNWEGKVGDTTEADKTKVPKSDNPGEG